VNKGRSKVLRGIGHFFDLDELRTATPRLKIGPLVRAGIVANRVQSDTFRSFEV
jgi:hypothetical protein